MLSYQHIFHAGNPADVHKHALLCAALSYMTRKDKPLSYLETHAGRAFYDLSSPEALKTGEAEAGVTALTEKFAPDHPYVKALDALRDQHGDTAYAGSPMLAAFSLRPTDKLHLAELHPQEFAALRDAMRPHNAKCYRQDGFEMAQAACPPEPRRGLMLIDPSYEIKSDYDLIPGQIAKLHRKWNVGVIALWYPILTSEAHIPMLRALKAQTLPDVLHHEVTFPPVRENHRMTGSGMFIVNAPYGSDDEARTLTQIFQP
ncbi:23S rRNA (adenine(2030)-N(6))-methyltransferase RlmJ [Litoreibacter arenae]|uniref:Ribosomal RNA large subunit methyltransferase J n=1 Tax=Litoreibacter arenae DSM 19593 TaxID=1123360 RepID=S9RTC9_9RHOB|nr:23S rRNA (adenine(2030)-N(6))-methyltransferase RlmJ [Litoreibacter arenae]EPX77199.1 Protein involved in catabolism of external DNA [Litoreibacter arenae DSM 19593]